MPNLAASTCTVNSSSFARWIMSVTAHLLDAMIMEGEDKLTQLLNSRGESVQRIEKQHRESNRECHGQ